jgi:hypothetical protein
MHRQLHKSQVGYQRQEGTMQEDVETQVTHAYKGILSYGEIREALD